MATIIDAILRLKDSFTPNLNRIRQQLSETRRTAMRASTDIKRMGSTMAGLGHTMMPVATGITAGIGYAAHQFADFSYSIMRTAHIAGASAEELHQLEEAAISIGSKLPMTINETSQAMAKLAAGGFNTQQIVGTIGAVGMAAEATGADISLVSDVITNAMSIWDMKSGDIAAKSSRVADVIQQACNKSKMSYDKFAVALQGGGNVAASFGESIERVTALMGVFANNGIGASNIGTTLRNAYVRLSADTDGAADKLEKLGVNVFDGNGKLRSMVDIVTELSGAIRGMSDEDLSPVLKSVFGMYALPGLSKVLRSDEAIKELNRLVVDMENATAATVRLQENVGGSADKLKAMGIEALNTNGKLKPMIDIVKQLHDRLQGMSKESATPLLKSILGDAATDDVVSKLISTSTTEEQLKQIAEHFQNFKGKSEVAFEAMQQTFGGKIKLMESTADAFIHKIGKALEPLLTPLIEGVTQVIQKFMQLDNETLTTILKISMGFVALTGAVLTVGSALTVFGKLVGFLAPIGAQLATATSLSALLAPKIAALGTGFRVLKNVGVLALNALLSPLRGLGALLVAPFGKLVQATTLMILSMNGGVGAAAALRTGLSSLALSIGFVGANGVTIFGRMGAAINGFATAAILGVSKFVGYAIMAPTFIVGAVGRIITAIRMMGSVQGVFVLLTHGIRALSLAFVSNPIGIALLALTGIILFVAANWQTFKNVAETVWNKIKFAVKDAVDSLKGVFNTFKSEVSKSFDDIIKSWNELTGSSETSSSAISKIINTLGSAITAAVIAIVTAVEGIIKAVMIVVSTVIGVFSGIIKFITGVFTGNWRMAWEGVKQVFTSIFGGIGKFFMNIIETVSNGIDRIRGKTTEAAAAARELEAKAIRDNETNVNAGGAALSRRRAADAAENASLGRAGGGVPAAVELDTSEAQSQIDGLGNASKANAEAILNNAQSTDQINQNLAGTGQSLEEMNQQLSQVTQEFPQSTEAFQQSLQLTGDGFSNLNTNVDSSKQALQQHTEIMNSNRDTIQQLGDIANIAKGFVQQLGEASNGTSSFIKSLGDIALNAASSFGQLGAAVSSVAIALANKAAEISSIHISVPTVSVVPTSSGGAPGQNYIGTNYWRGGLTWVHEQGPELIDLPSGTRIVPHSRSLQEEYRRGYDDAMVSVPPTSVMPMALSSGVVSNSSSKIREAQETGNAASNIGKEFTSNADRNILPAGSTGNAQSNLGREYVNNVQSDIAEAEGTGNKSSNIDYKAVNNAQSDITEAEDTGNKSSIFNTSTVQNPQSNFANETVSNVQSQIECEYVNNASQKIKEAEDTGNPADNHKYESTGMPSSIFSKDTVNNAQTNISDDTVSNPTSNIDYSPTGHPQSKLGREYVNNAQSNIDREYVNNPQSNVKREYVSNVQTDIKDSTVNNPQSDILEAEPTGNKASNISYAPTGQPSTNIKTESTKNPQTNILHAEDTGNAQSNIHYEPNSQPISNIDIAESTGNPQSDNRPMEPTGRPTSNNRSADSMGNPSTNISYEPTGNAQSNIHSNNQGQNIYAPNLSLSIAKIADTVVVREDADISRLADRVVNKIVFWFQGHANNRIVGAVR